MFPFLLTFLSHRPPNPLLALSYFSSPIFNRFLYQMYCASKPNSLLFPRDIPFAFLPLDLGLWGSFATGTNGVPLSGSSPAPLETTFDCLSCSPQIHQHPKRGVTSLPQQLHCVPNHSYLYHIHPKLTHLLFCASGLFLVLFPLSARMFCKTCTHLSPFLHSGLCSSATPQITPSHSRPPAPDFHSPYPACVSPWHVTPPDVSCLFLMAVPTGTPCVQGLCHVTGVSLVPTT